MTRKLGPSLKSQKVEENVWYYEYRGRISLVIHADLVRKANMGSIMIDIPKRKLQASLRRMNEGRRI